MSQPICCCPQASEHSRSPTGRDHHRALKRFIRTVNNCYLSSARPCVSLPIAWPGEKRGEGRWGELVLLLVTRSLRETLALHRADGFGERCVIGHTSDTHGTRSDGGHHERAYHLTVHPAVYIWSAGSRGVLMLCMEGGTSTLNPEIPEGKGKVSG